MSFWKKKLKEQDHNYFITSFDRYIFNRCITESIWKNSFVPNHYLFHIRQLLFNGQHGFRTSHSCETALHQLLSDLNEIRRKRVVALLLFIDFRKAFDLVYAELLILKLVKYGFSNNAIKLIANYFQDRSQTVKYNGKLTDYVPTDLGVPQGSTRPTLLSYIHKWLIIELICKMFEYDTTLYSSEENVERLIGTSKLKHWC